MSKITHLYEYWRPEDAELYTPYEKRFVAEVEFLQFGLNCTETENNIASWTSAIVEMPDGSIKNVDVEMIVFIYE